MAGPRFTDWTSIHVVGADKASGAQYIPQARKLLGYVMSTGLGMATMQRTLDDGTKIVAEKFGEIPRITIYPSGGRKPKRPIRLFDDLVLDPGSAGFSGGDRTIPPVIASADDDLNWKSHFFRGSSPGFFPGAGTYADVYPKTIKENTDQLMVGNYTWASADNERVAYLTVFQYWAPPYRHPDSVFSKEASHLGFTMGLFNYEGPEGDPLDEKHIMGAAIRDGWLYCVMGELGVLDYTPRPSVPTEAFECWASEPFSSDPIPMVLRRFKLKIKTEDSSGVQHYQVVNGSHEDLWSASLERSYAPWVFNDDCTEAVSFKIPDEVTEIWEAGEVTTAASTAAGLRLSLDITHEEDGSASASYGTSASGDVVAEDNGNTLQLVRLAGADWDWVWGTNSCPAVRWTGTSYTSRAIAFIDLRSGRAVFYELVSEFSVALDPDTATNVTETLRAIVYNPDTGEEEIDSADEGPTPILRPVRLGLLNDYENQVIAGTSPLAQLYIRRVGSFFGTLDYNEDTVEADEDIAYYAALYLPSHMVMSISEDSGTSNGGISINQPTSIDPGDWEWGTTHGYGPGDSVLPYHDDSDIFYIHYGAAATDRWMAFSSQPSFFGDERQVNYITNGDLGDITGGGFPEDFVPGMYILGSPILTQPRERD